MPRRVATLFIACLAITCAGRAVEAAGSLEGAWVLNVDAVVVGPPPNGAGAPFDQTDNTFQFVQSANGAPFSGQNSPANGSGLPFCSMKAQFVQGKYFLGYPGDGIGGGETCGIPRNSYGSVVGYLDQNGRSMRMIWIDSKGIYWINAGKQ